MTHRKRNEPTPISHSRPTVGEQEIRAVSDTIAALQLSQGRQVEKFEQAFAHRLGAPAVAAVGSGTAALHLALLALGAGPGDEIVIPSFVCSAVLNAVTYTGATPVLADIDPITFNIDPQDVKRRLTGRTRALVVPHLFGLPADMDALMQLNVPIVEDCAQAVGSARGQRAAGTIGAVSVFSFYATKMITTGEGGMVASPSAELIDRVRDLREYDNRRRYRLRFNYKMTDMQAAMGRVQLRRLDEFVQRRRSIAGRYRRLLASLPLRLPPTDPGHIYYRFVVTADGDAASWIEAAARMGVCCARPVHTPIHRLLGVGGCPETEKTWYGSFSIPIYPSLSDAAVERVCRTLEQIAERRTVE